MRLYTAPDIARVSGRGMLFPSLKLVCVEILRCCRALSRFASTCAAGASRLSPLHSSVGCHERGLRPRPLAVSPRLNSLIDRAASPLAGGSSIYRKRDDRSSGKLDSSRIPRPRSPAACSLLRRLVGIGHRRFRQAAHQAHTASTADVSGASLGPARRWPLQPARALSRSSAKYTGKPTLGKSLAIGRRASNDIGDSHRGAQEGSTRLLPALAESHNTVLRDLAFDNAVSRRSFFPGRGIDRKDSRGFPVGLTEGSTASRIGNYAPMADLKQPAGLRRDDSSLRRRGPARLQS